MCHKNIFVPVRLITKSNIDNITLISLNSIDKNVKLIPVPPKALEVSQVFILYFLTDRYSSSAFGESWIYTIEKPILYNINGISITGNTSLI